MVPMTPSFTTCRMTTMRSLRCTGCLITSERLSACSLKGGYLSQAVSLGLCLFSLLLSGLLLLGLRTWNSFCLQPTSCMGIAWVRSSFTTKFHDNKKRRGFEVEVWEGPTSKHGK